MDNNYIFQNKNNEQKDWNCFTFVQASFISYSLWENSTLYLHKNKSVKGH